MPYETLRFIHAARLLVDCPLTDIGTVRPELRGLGRDATTLAFHNLISACVDHEVDFLLLTGDSLRMRDFSVRALVELRDGFDLLNDAGIQVFVVPGAQDPASVWDQFPDWPNNVTVFRPEVDDPVAVLRDGAVIASIRALAWRRPWFSWDDEHPSADRVQRRSVEADETEAVEDPIGGEAIQPARPDSHRETRRVQSASELRPNHFAIAVVRDGLDAIGEKPQADYLAIVGGRERNTVKGEDWLLHFPGGTQGTSAEQTDLHGCSIVDLDSDGVIRCRFLATAPVRWENLDVEIGDPTTWQQLRWRLRMAFRDLCGIGDVEYAETLFAEAPPVLEGQRGGLVAEHDDADDGEATVEPVVETPIPAAQTEVRMRELVDLQSKAVFLRWTVRGCGEVFDSLSHEARRMELIAWLERDSSWPKHARVWHRFRLLATSPANLSSENGGFISNDDGETLDVPNEFAWRVDQGESVGAAAWSDLGQESSAASERLARVTGVIPRADAAVVFSQARRRGWSWFGRKTA